MENPFHLGNELPIIGSTFCADCGHVDGTQNAVLQRKKEERDDHGGRQH